MHMDMKRVLVVDDDQDILEAVQFVLDGGGYEAEVTNRGEETFSKIREFKPDLIILDVLLSGSDGRKICKQLKNEQENKHIPILMLSAHPSAKDTIKACGADSFLAKPFEVKQLLAEVDKFLGKAGAVT